jgi:aldehyde:ferredoxin oxidoreductase
VAILNGIKALPIRNLQRTSDPKIKGITGETLADDTLLRNTACSGCPVGCIHIGFVREKFMEPNQYLYRQVSYDHEPVFAAGCMLGMTNAFSMLGILDTVEKMGLDVMSAGVALAWATEALEKSVISEKETLVPLKFDDAAGYKEAVQHLGLGSNDFYRLLAQGTMKVAEQYGGEDFACVLGQEMGGYATGEVFFTSQALGFRHSHLDSGGYSFDQKHEEKDVKQAVDFLVKDEQGRVLLTSMVSCLFAREVYKDELLADCLNTLGYTTLAGNMQQMAQHVQKMRWRLRVSTGFDPQGVKIPRRFTEVTTWKGKVDEKFLNALKKEYAKRIMDLAKDEEK